MAYDLNDTKLIKNISCEDPIAQELKYHRKCYVAVRNRARSFNRHKEREMKNTSESDFLYARAFAEVESYIHEKNC